MGAGAAAAAAHQDMGKSHHKTHEGTRAAMHPNPIPFPPHLGIKAIWKGVFGSHRLATPLLVLFGNDVLEC